MPASQVYLWWFNRQWDQGRPMDPRFVGPLVLLLVGNTPSFGPTPHQHRWSLHRWSSQASLKGFSRRSFSHPPGAESWWMTSNVDRTTWTPRTLAVIQLPNQPLTILKHQKTIKPSQLKLLMVHRRPSFSKPRVGTGDGFLHRTQILRGIDGRLHD